MYEEFEKVNDYTLAVKMTMDTLSGNSYSKGKYQLTRIFNFASQQITTLARDWMHQDRGSESGGSSASALQMTVQNFGDLESQMEVELMRKKLVELKGNPPSAESSLGKAKLAAPGNG